jgi:hypothetical protein
VVGVLTPHTVEYGKYLHVADSHRTSSPSPSVPPRPNLLDLSMASPDHASQARESIFSRTLSAAEG